MILHQNIFVSNSNLIFNLNSISKLILIILLKFCVTIDGAVNENISSSHSLIGNQQNHIFVSSNNWSQQNGMFNFEFTTNLNKQMILFTYTKYPVSVSFYGLIIITNDIHIERYSSQTKLNQSHNTKSIHF